MWTRDTAAPRPGHPLQVTQRAALVLAPNANAWTFEGTNSWLLAEPGSDVCAVVDPGPDDDEHLAALLAAAGHRRIVGVLVTHIHHDHAQLAPRLAAVTGAPVHAVHPRLTDRPVSDGEMLSVGSLQVRVLATPGHTGDSVCFSLPAEGSVLTGDTVLGRGSPVVEPGRLGQFFTALERLGEEVAAPGSVILPGHGPALPDPQPELERRLRSRRRRVDQVAHGLAAGVVDLEDLVDLVHPGIAPDLRDAARMSVAASMAHVQTVPDPVPT